MGQDTRTAREGIVVGLVAYASVAALYALFDQLAARGTLYTLDLLGKSLFRGLRDPGVLALPQQPDLAAMVLYNGVHLAASLVIGFVVASLAVQAERHPGRGPLVGLVLVAGFVATILAVGVLTAPIRPLLPWWSIVVANALAVVFAGWYLVRRHPELPHRLLPFGGHPA